jgi:hypothetical protein
MHSVCRGSIHTRPLIMPLLRVNRAGLDGFEASLTPSGPRGVDNLPPIVDSQILQGLEASLYRRWLMRPSEQDGRVHGHYDCRLSYDGGGELR